MKKDYVLGLSEEGFHRIAYTEWGIENHSSVPVICVHGLTRNSRDFDSLASYLMKYNHLVFCPDIVGRGDSDWLKNPLHYTYEQYVADMNALIARTQAKRVDWIGTSMGGIIGMYLAAQTHSPIRKLILNDVGPQISVSALSRLAKYAGREPHFVSIDEAKNYFKRIYADFGDLSDAEWQKFTEDSVREVSPNVYVTKLDQGIKIAQAKSKFAWKALMHPMKALEGTLFDVNLWDIFRKIKCPVLVIHGQKSDILVPATIQKMKAIHPDTELLTVQNAGHAPALLKEEQHVFITEWLNREIS